VHYRADRHYRSIRSDQGYLLDDLNIVERVLLLSVPLLLISPLIDEQPGGHVHHRRHLSVQFLGFVPRLEISSGL
jgi:hypothetical protein